MKKFQLPWGVLLVFVCGSRLVRAASIYEANPFLNGGYQPQPTASTTVPPITTSITTIPDQLASTKEPIFTIEPPYVQYDLNRFCLQPKGQFPISGDCDSYVNCWNGHAIQQSCPSGFLFNPIKLYCDYPLNVDCKGRSEALQGNGLQSTPLIVHSGSNNFLRKFCLKSTGLFPGSTCGKFVNCWNDDAVEQDCPAGLHFSPEGYCDYPERVACDLHNQGHRVQESNMTPSISECPLEFGIFRDRTNCSQYYTCSFHNIAARHSCPEGFSFSDVLGICDYSYRVDCSKEPQIYDRQHLNKGFTFDSSLNQLSGGIISSNAYAHSELTQPTTIGDIRCIVPFGYSRDSGNCSIYYTCEKGLVVDTHHCPLGYAFSNVKNACDESRNVNCGSGLALFYKNSGSLIVPNIPNEMLSQVRNCIPGTTFRLNPDCTTACRCQSGVAEIIQCSDGLAYDSQMDKCVPRNIARC